jgi:very-short-patch-repair endonuclease
MATEYALDPVIEGQSHTRGIDAVIAALAARQHGVASRRQLLALGIGAGTKALRTLLLNARRSLRSPLEAEFLAFVDKHGIERPETNTIIEGYEVDAVWREQRLIVELDGFATHGTRAAFEQDRVRDRRLTAKGWRPIRLTSLNPAEAEELAALGAPRINRG